jgi:uncharacterized protein (TIRG00374 family)
MNRWLKRFFQIASLALFAAILWWGGPEAWRQMQAGDWRFVLLALLLRGAAGMIASVRLLVTTQAVTNRRAFSWRQLYYLTMTARALGLVIPRSVSTIGGKSVALRSFGVSLKRSVWIIVLDNLFDVVLLTAVILPGLLYLQEVVNDTGFILLLLITNLLLLGVTWWSLASGRLHAWLVWLLPLVRRVRWLAKRLTMTDEKVQRLLPPPPQAVVAMGLSIVLHLILAASFYAIGRSVNVDAAMLVYAAGYPLVQLSLIAAVTPGGIGIFELGWLGLLVFGGVAQEEALAFTVAQRAYIFIFVLVWAGVSLLLSLTERKKPEQ